jgi:signal transduction histidine kinase/DNA-binding response OmpR family regulator/ligand-binding sensor domain-containing protein
MKLRFIFCLLWLIHIPLISATPHYAFRSINERFGISVRDVSAVCQDADGLIWAAAKTGILRITPDDYSLYTLPFETTDVLLNKIVCQDGLMVAYTNNGQIFRYNPITDQFERLFNMSKLLNDAYLWVSNLLIDSHGDIWISCSSGLYLWKDEQLQSVYGRRRNISNVAKGDATHLFAFTRRYIDIIDTEQTTDAVSDSIQLGVNFDVSAAYYDVKTQKLWIGSPASGLWQYDMSQHLLRHISMPTLAKHLVRDIKLIDNKLWVGTEGSGILILDREGQQVCDVLKEDLDNPPALPDNGIYALFQDSNQQIWICTSNEGLVYTKLDMPIVEHIAHQRNVSQSLSNNRVNRMVEDSRENLWFATNNGLSRLDRKTQTWTHYYSERLHIFRSLETDGRGHLYVGTYDEGLYVLDEQTGRELRHYTQNDGRLFGLGNFVFDIYCDHEGDVWIGGTVGSLYCYSQKEQQLKRYAPQPIYCITEYTPGQLLLGCTYGLLLFDKASGKEEVILTDRTVYDIAVVGNLIWLGTSGDGLICFDMDTRKIVQHIDTQSGLPSNYVNSTQVVDGLLWLGTEQGLCLFNPGNHNVQTFASICLLSDVSFNINAACRLHDGRLAFGSNNGAIIFNPKDLNNASPSGHIYFSDIRVGGRSIRRMPDFQLKSSINNSDSLILDYRRNGFTLDVLPLGNISKFAAFSWKLQGQDADWAPITANRVINYTNLSAGDYRLDLRLYDGRLLSERSLVVCVKPPFWHTWWFRIVIILFIAGIACMAMRSYTNRLRQHYAEEKIRFFAQMAHEIRNTLTLIKGPIEELKRSSNLSEWETECAHIASDQAQTLSDTATQLLDFQKLDVGRERPLYSTTNIVELLSRCISVYESYAYSKQITISFAATPKSYRTAVDVKMIDRVVDNLISNAVKYSSQGQTVDILFTGNEKCWTLSVKDYGIGISKPAQRKLFREFYRSDNAVNAQTLGSGIGLLMAKKYVELHGGTIDVQSALNEGSTFTVSIPHREVIPQRGEVPAAITDMTSHAPADLKEVLQGIPKRDMHILVVEDNRALREFVARPLAEYFEVSTASDGQKAWAYIQKKMPDLVVSDVMMPNMDGFELCRLIKSTFETSHIPVILLTALSDKPDQLHGLGLGADNYLIKPFDLTLLASRIKSIIQNRRATFEKALTTHADKDSDTPVAENVINNQFVEDAIKIIRANINNANFGKEEFARALYVSPSLLYKKIKSLTNLSPVEFVKNVKLNYAMELLQSGQHNVVEVSEMAGFNSSTYFIKVFRDRFGVTPKQVVSKNTKLQ